MLGSFLFSCLKNGAIPTVAFVLFTIYFCCQPNTSLWSQDIYFGDQVTFTDPDLDAQFEVYEVFSLDVAPLHEAILGQLDYHFILQLGEIHEWHLNLSLNELTAPDFEWIKLEENGQELLSPPLPFTYEGFNNPPEGDLVGDVRMSIRQDALVGYIFQNSQQFYIEPLSYFLEDVPADYFLVYQPENTLSDNSEVCGVELEQNMLAQLPLAAMGLSKSEVNCQQVEMLALATNDMVAHLGGEVAVLYRIFDITNQMEGYFAFAGLDFVIKQFFISNSPNADPIAASIDADTILSRTMSWAANPANNVRSHDIGQLWVKRDIAGCGQSPTNFGLWGCGNQAGLQSGVCQPRRYSVCELADPKISWMARLSAHEVGHNFGAGHNDDPNGLDLMDASVTRNSSLGFATASENFMTARINSPNGSCIKLCPELCDLMVVESLIMPETCLGQQNGSIIVNASTSFQPLQYSIVGPVTRYNQDGNFSNIPAGTYQVTLTNEQFEDCTIQFEVVVPLKINEPPTLICPGNITVNNTSGSCNASAGIAPPQIVDDCGGGGLQYRFVKVDDNGNPIDIWSNWQNWAPTDLSPTLVLELEVGTWKVEWRYMDDAGQEAVCSVCAEVIDTDAFIMYCPASFSTSLSMGSCDLFVAPPLPAIFDNCDAYTLLGRIRGIDAQGNPLPGIAGQWSGYSINLADIYQPGHFEVEWMATDLGQHTQQCTFTFEIRDDEFPYISCSPDYNVANDPGECEAFVSLPAPNATDNCGIAWLKGRYRRVDVLGNPIPGAFGAWTSFADNLSGDYSVGNYQIHWQARDPNGNETDCFYLLGILDQEQPLAHCRDNTVFLEAGGQHTIQDFDVFDFFQSSDNCHGLQLVLQPSVVNCSQANSLVPVQVTAWDDSGNTRVCTSFLQVEIADELPDGWDSDAIGFTTGNTIYDPCMETFSLETIGVSSPFNDLIQMAFQSQCGDFDLVAKVSQVTNGGFGGIMIRENNYSGARKIALKTQLTTRVYRQFRFSTDGFASTSFLQRYPTHPWLRIARTGSNFTGYSSTNGSDWKPAFSVSLNLPNCIMAGVYAESLNGGTTTTAQFAQVSFNVGSPLQAPGNTPENALIRPSINSNQHLLYPNPAKDVLHLELSQGRLETAAISIHTISGQIIWQEFKAIPEESPISIDIRNLPNGTYFLRINNGAETLNSRFVKH